MREPLLLSEIVWTDPDLSAHFIWVPCIRPARSVAAAKGLSEALLYGRWGVVGSGA